MDYKRMKRINNMVETIKQQHVQQSNTRLAQEKIAQRQKEIDQQQKEWEVEWSEAEEIVANEEQGSIVCLFSSGRIAKCDTEWLKTKEKEIVAKAQQRTDEIVADAWLRAGQSPLRISLFWLLFVLGTVLLTLLAGMCICR